MAQIDYEAFPWSTPRECQSISFLHHLVVRWSLRVLHELTILLCEGVQDPVLFERKAVKGNDEGDELAQPVATREVYRRGYEDDRTVGVVELETVAIDKANGGMRAEQRNGQHFKEVSTDLNCRIDSVLDSGFRSKVIFILFAS